MTNNPLVDVVRAFPEPAREALYAAATSGRLRRGTWHGCPLSRAGVELGVPVRSRGEAAYALGVSPETARSFVQAWDRLWGSNRRRARILRDALVRVEQSEDTSRPAIDWDAWAHEIDERPLVLD
jgi:hypothetical protein